MIALADAGTTFQHAANGSLLLAVPVALLAGLVSFLSPCVLPLVPGYLSYVTGLSGADLAADTYGAGSEEQERRAQMRRISGRVFVGSLLFVLGLALVYVSEGALFGNLRPSPQPPGRGTLVRRRDGQQLIQTAFWDR